MIDSVLIEQFKSIERLRVDLSRLTVLVGPNAAGKSSILQAIELALRQATRPQPVKPNELLPSLRKCTGISADQLLIELETGDDRLQLRLRHAPEWAQVAGGVASHAPEAMLVGKSGEPANLSESSSQRIARDFGAPAIFALDPHVCRQPQEFQRTLIMGYRGDHATSMLGLLAGEHSARFQMLQDDLKSVLKTVISLRIERIPWNDENGAVSTREVMFFDTVTGKGLSAFQVSDGTIIATALLGAIHAASSLDDISPILLIDDIDHGLHPLAQAEIVQAIHRMMERHPRLQVVLTTHSPFVVDAVDPSSVRLVSLDKDGTTRCLPLTDHPEFNRWKDEFAPGELWNLFGEDWVSEPSRLEAEAQ